MFFQCIHEKGKTELGEDKGTGIMYQGRECSGQVILLYSDCRIKMNNVGKIHHTWAVEKIRGLLCEAWFPSRSVYSVVMERANSNSTLRQKHWQFGQNSLQELNGAINWERTALMRTTETSRLICNREHLRKIQRNCSSGRWVQKREGEGGRQIWKHGVCRGCFFTLPNKDWRSSKIKDVESAINIFTQVHLPWSRWTIICGLLIKSFW